MAVEILRFRILMKMCILVLQCPLGYCTMDIVRSLRRGNLKTQPLFLNISFNEETKVTTYQGRFTGPSDLKSETKGSLLKVSNDRDSSEFEMIAKFSYDEYPRNLILKSESTSETLDMMLNNDAAHTMQTTFIGTRCVFEVTRSKEEEIEEYSSRLTNCGRDISQFYGGHMTIDGRFEPILDIPTAWNKKNIEKYLNITDNLTSSFEESIVTLNKLTMAKDNVQLKSLYVNVLGVGLKPLNRQDISEIITWRFDII